jgi:hypothetical protein
VLFSVKVFSPLLPAAHALLAAAASFIEKHTDKTPMH